MEKYIYKGLNQKDNKIVRGEMKAFSLSEIEASLKGMDILLISYKIEKKSFLSEFSFLEKVSTRDMITLFSHLERLDSAGVSIIDSLYDIKNSTSYPQSIRNIVQELYESVRNGSLFSESLEKHPKIFDSIYVGLIANGEKTGKLNKAFGSVVENLKWNDAMKKKTAKALRYPLFSLVIMLITIMIMTNLVVPKIIVFLNDQNIDLPSITIGLMVFSSFMQNNSLFIIAGIPMLIMIYKILRRFSNFAYVSDEIKLNIPIFGAIIKKIDASRFCNFFSITFESGIGILECLDSTKQVISNLAIRESIDGIKQRVSDGQPLATSIDASNHFAPLVVRMFKVGEDSGDMTKSLKEIKFFYDEEIDDSIDKLVGMIQPSLTLAMGGMMLWITAAIFGPIYDSFSEL